MTWYSLRRPVIDQSKCSCRRWVPSAQALLTMTIGCVIPVERDTTGRNDRVECICRGVKKISMFMFAYCRVSVPVHVRGWRLVVE